HIRCPSRAGSITASWAMRFARSFAGRVRRAGPIAKPTLPVLAPGEKLTGHHRWHVPRARGREQTFLRRKETEPNPVAFRAENEALGRVPLKAEHNRQDHGVSRRRAPPRMRLVSQGVARNGMYRNVRVTFRAHDFERVEQARQDDRWIVRAFGQYAVAARLTRSENVVGRHWLLLVAAVWRAADNLVNGIGPHLLTAIDAVQSDLCVASIRATPCLVSPRSTASSGSVHPASRSSSTSRRRRSTQRALPAASYCRTFARCAAVSLGAIPWASYHAASTRSQRQVRRAGFVVSLLDVKYFRARLCRMWTTCGKSRTLANARA